MRRTALLGTLTALALFPGSALAASRPHIESQPGVIGVRLSGPRVVVAIGSYDNPWVTRGRPVASLGTTGRVVLTLRLYARRTGRSLRLLGVAGTSAPLQGRRDLARIVPPHRFHLSARLGALLAAAWAAHDAVAWSIVVQQRLLRGRHILESWTTRTRLAPLRRLGATGAAIGANYQSADGLENLATSTAGGLHVTQIMVVHLGSTYSGSYTAVNNAPISSASTFTLADHFGSLARWNGEIPNSGWWLNPENGGNALSQTAGTGIPGASGTF